MNGLHTVTSAFGKIDRYLADSLEMNGKVGCKRASRAIGRERQINGFAYLLLAWGQLEADITEACRNVIRRGQSQKQWRDRRAWSLYNPDDRRLSGLRFENRLMLVLEKDNDDWKRVMDLYGARNRIAHGGLDLENFDMRIAARDLHRVQSSFVRD